MAISRFSTSRLTQGLPKYQTAWDQDAVEQGALVPIANGTVTGTSGDFTFSNIPQTYQDLYIVVGGRSTNAGNYGGVYIGFSGQYGGNTNYSFTQVYSNTAGSPSSQRTTSQPFVGGDGGIPAASAAAGIVGHAMINVFDYTSTNKFKTYLLRSSADSNSAGGFLAVSAGIWRNTSAITSMYITLSGAFANGSTVAIYGVKAGV